MQWSSISFFSMGQYCFTDCHLYEYHYINEEKTWTEAQQYCREKHTDSATVTNMADMKRLLSKSPGNMKEAWIGSFSKPEFNRRWYWSSPGVEFNESETNWNSGEPTDKGMKGSENCGFLNTHENLKWTDSGCENARYFLCNDAANRNQTYHLIRAPKTWQKAQSYCREKHTDSISGMKQLQDGESKKLIIPEGNNKYIHIGSFRDTWRWSDGSSFSFRHWHESFNNQQPDSAQCVMIRIYEKDMWKDDCTVKKPFICYDDKVISVKEKMNWEEALYYCREHHHDSVTITNSDEQRWVQEKAKNASTDYVWMGSRYSCTSDLWFWVSDEVVSYKNWASKEQMDDCDMSGAMETGGKHQWFKRNDSKEFNFFCSIK